ncbi:hypothetical protein YC2023_098309 [Brassica napus]
MVELSFLAVLEVDGGTVLELYLHLPGLTSLVGRRIPIERHDYYSTYHKDTNLLEKTN